MNKILFNEEQQFRQWWQIVLMLATVIPVIVVNIYSLFQQIVCGVQVGDSPAPNVVMIISLLFMGVVLFLFFYAKLTVWIDNDGIHYHFFPFLFKEKVITKSEIRHSEIRRYKPIFDYGGWGVKRSLKWGKAYNVSGNSGLQLYLNNGRKVLFGTQRPQAIVFAMDEMMKVKPEVRKS